MSTYVVDVNVAIVANGHSSPQADAKCETACIDILMHVQKIGLVIIDDRMRILNEYRRHLSPSGQPGLGDSFMKWLCEIQANDKYCKRISITPRSDNPNDPEDYLEFPDDPALEDFDPSDRKYAAVALASGLDPEILNAVDTDWWEFKDVLESHKVRINFLCPHCMQAGISKKKGRH